MPTLEQPSSAVLDTRGPRFGDPEKMWVVVGAGARDSYQAPLALHQAGLLRALITDFYTPLDRRFARAAFKIIPSRAADKLWRRFHPELPSRVVRSQFKYAIRNLLRPDRWPSQVHLLGQTAARIAAETDCGILAYSHVASAAFSAPGVPKVLFQMQRIRLPFVTRSWKTLFVRASLMQRTPSSIGIARPLPDFQKSPY
jgi:hypothetical protein